VQRILILAANPKNTPQIRLDEEVREISEGLRRAQRRDEFELRAQWATRPQDIRRAMLDVQPNIVHFCGHGEGEDGLAFEDKTGQVQLVSAEALASLFELFADSVQCVVLNACYSVVQAEAIAQQIHYVIGMNRGVDDEAALEFAVAFYDALGAGKSPEFAYKLGCSAIQMIGLPDNLTPVLITKPGLEDTGDQNDHQSPVPKIVTAFISYNLGDQQFVEEVANALCQRGILPWLDTDDLESLKQVIDTRMGIVGFLPKSDLAAGQLQRQLQDMLHVEHLDISELLPASSADQTADKLSRKLYRQLQFKGADDINIVVDQRGTTGYRKELYHFPETFLEKFPELKNHPTLVFRPDIGKRSQRETIVGEQWEIFRQTIQDSLSSALGLLTGKTIHILGNAQLGIPYFLGQHCFDRLNFVTLHCYHIGLGNDFSNEEWMSLYGGKASEESISEEESLSEQKKRRLRRQLCDLEKQWELLTEQLSGLEQEKILETRPDEEFRLEHKVDKIKNRRIQLEQEMSEVESQLASGKEIEESEPGEKHEKVALYVGFSNLFNDVKAHVKAESPLLRLVPILRGKRDFKTDNDVMKLIQDVIARLQHLCEQKGARIVHLYCALPFNVVPLLAAHLVNISVTIRFMEFRKDLTDKGCPSSKLYTHLPMKEYDRDLP